MQVQAAGMQPATPGQTGPSTCSPFGTAPCSWTQPWPGSLLPEPAQTPPSAAAQLEPNRLQFQDGFISLWRCTGCAGLSSPGHECWPEDAQKEGADTTCHRNMRNGRVGGEDHQHDSDGQRQGLPACPVSRQSARGHTRLGLAGGTGCPTPGLQEW